jgi:hypothetical protein
MNSPCEWLLFVLSPCFQILGKWQCCFASSDGPITLLQDLVFKGARLRKVNAGDLDDGLPCGFLAGPIVEVWVALRLNWA